MEAIQDILDKTAKSEALIARPADDTEIEKCDRDLREMGLLPLPEGYARFLKSANGYAWNGFEFFGTDRCKEDSSDYVLKNIVEFNEYIRERMGCSDDVLVLGRFDEDIYIYDYSESRYKAIDRLTSMDADEFEDFEDLLTSTVGLYAGEEDEDDDYDEG